MTTRALLLLSLAALPATPLLAAETAAAAEAPPESQGAVDDAGGEIIVTARRRAESLQDVPIALSVVEAARLDQTQTFNINRFTQLVPSVNFVSSNPRNSAILIRGLGAPFGLTNVLTNQDINSQENIGFRGAILFTPDDDLKISIAGDYNTQNPVCCGQVHVRTASTPLRPARNFEALARLSNYAPPSRNAFDTQYFDFLTAGPGGTGLDVGQPGDPRTWGLTLAKRF